MTRSMFGVNIQSRSLSTNTFAGLTLLLCLGFRDVASKSDVVGSIRLGATSSLRF